MILTSIHDFRRYQGLNSRFSALADLLESGRHKTLAAGRNDIAGDELYAIASPEAATRSSAMLEAHRRYIDVHVVISGNEGMGWAPLTSVSIEDSPFNAEQDYVLYRDTRWTNLIVTPDDLTVFFPEDAHVPLLGDGQLVRKCVFKVRVD